MRRCGLFGLTVLIAACAAFGQTWTVQNSGTMVPLGGVDFPDRDHGWVGGSSFFLQTTDGGASWAQNEASALAHAGAICFVNDSLGWGAGTMRTIVHTTDGGATWIAQSGGENLALSDLTFVNPQMGWVVGEYSTILHTSDGGQSWVNQTLSGTVLQPLSDVSFVNENIGWVSSYTGVIAHTSDGGGTWALQVNDESWAGFTAISAGDAQNAWAVGYDGAIYHTGDGGATWQSQTSGTSYTFYDVAFADNNTGCAVGPHGTIVRTTTGGQTWIVDMGITTHTLGSVTFSDPENAWVAGDSGTILHYESPSGIQSGTAAAVSGGFSLSPNYPNPFNPSTTLRFSVPKLSNVSLDVFDLLGRKTAMLYSGMLQAGEHEVVWNCSDCPSGMYVARMRVGNRTLQREMLLLK